MNWASPKDEDADIIYTMKLPRLVLVFTLLPVVMFPGGAAFILAEYFQMHVIKKRLLTMTANLRACVIGFIPMCFASHYMLESAEIDATWAGKYVLANMLALTLAIFVHVEIDYYFHKKKIARSNKDE